MLKNKTRSKAYACFMSGGNRVLENLSGMVRDSAAKLELSTVKILYGIIKNGNFLKSTNHLLLIAKYYIYCCSINKEPLYLRAYLTIVVSKAEVEKQISIWTNSNERCYNKWKPLIDKGFVA